MPKRDLDDASENDVVLIEAELDLKATCGAKQLRMVSVWKFALHDLIVPVDEIKIQGILRLVPSRQEARARDLIIRRTDPKNLEATRIADFLLVGSENLYPSARK